jgi:hypothetical protein
MANAGTPQPNALNDTITAQEEHDTFTREELDRAIKDYNEERQVSSCKFFSVSTPAN